MERKILLLGDPRLYEVSEEVKREELEELRLFLKICSTVLKESGEITDLDVQSRHRR